MAGKVFFSVTMSLDGFIAPESVPVDDFFAPDKQDDPDVQRWRAQWTELQQWALPEEAPFHTPVFVVTHTKRDPWERPGGTTFHFVNDGIEHALDHAREAAGDRDVRIAGGGATILEHLNAGLVDEFSITLSPVLFGAGTRLFDGVDASRVALEPVRSEPSSRVTHLTYAVHPR
jgi:dihydrofolate reductase